jgi:putative oxidoreductase
VYSAALLIVGLASQLATLPLLSWIMTIQLFVYPQAWSEHLLTGGPGAFSLDHWIGLESSDGVSS